MPSLRTHGAEAVTTPASGAPTDPDADKEMVFDLVEDDDDGMVAEVILDDSDQPAINVKAVIGEIERRTGETGPRANLSALRNIPEEIPLDAPLAETRIDAQKKELDEKIPELEGALHKINRELAKTQVQLSNPSGEVTVATAESLRPAQMPPSVDDITSSIVPGITAYAVALAREQMRTVSAPELEKRRNLLVLERESVIAELEYSLNLVSYCGTALDILDAERKIEKLYEPDAVALTGSVATASAELKTAEDKVHNASQRLANAQKQVGIATLVLEAIDQDDAGAGKIGELGEELQGLRDERTSKDAERQKAEEAKLRLQNKKDTEYKETPAQTAVKNLRIQMTAAQATLAELRTSADALLNDITDTTAKINELREEPHNVASVPSVTYTFFAPSETGNGLVGALQAKCGQVKRELADVESGLDQKKKALDDATDALNGNTDHTKTRALSRAVTEAEDAYDNAKSEAVETLGQLLTELRGIHEVRNELLNTASQRFRTNFPEEYRVLQFETMLAALRSALSEKGIATKTTETVADLEPKFNAMMTKDESKRAELDEEIARLAETANGAKERVTALDTEISDLDGLRIAMETARRKDKPVETQRTALIAKQEKALLAQQILERESEAALEPEVALGDLQTALGLGEVGRADEKTALRNSIAEWQFSLQTFIDNGDTTGVITDRRNEFVTAYRAFKTAEAAMNPKAGLREKMVDVATEVVAVVLPEINRVLDVSRESRRLELAEALAATPGDVQPLEERNMQLRRALREARRQILLLGGAAFLSLGIAIGSMITRIDVGNPVDEDAPTEGPALDDNNSNKATQATAPTSPATRPTPSQTPAVTPATTPLPTGSSAIPTPTPSSTPAATPTPIRRTTSPTPRPTPTPTPTSEEDDSWQELE